MLVFCQECEKATGTGYFSGKPQHDRFVKSPWNTHQLEEREPATDKASWMLLCPVCKDEAVIRTPEAGFTTKHPTVGVDENGDEIVKCTACGRLYRFNLKWTFEKKELPPTPRPIPKRLYLVQPSENCDLEEIELYRSEETAQQRLTELEAEALRDVGYEETSDEGFWRSPHGETLDHADALEQAEASVQYFVRPAELVEVIVCD